MRTTHRSAIRKPAMDEESPLNDRESSPPGSRLPSAGTAKSWAIAIAAAIVVLAGVGSVALVTRPGGNDESSPGESASPAMTLDAPDSIEGRWVIESWAENDVRVMVEVGVNTVAEAWIEFTQTFEGERASFISADGVGTAGTFVGSTGCNGIHETGYEYSASFLVLEKAVVQAVGCEPDRAEQVLLAMLWNTPDGIEVVPIDGDRVELYGSNVHGVALPLVLRRHGTAAPDPGDDSATTTQPPGEEPSVQVYDVDGIEVVTATRVEELPERAARVEFTSTVIDSGDGPELCLGGVNESLPPQCSGPVAAGLDMEGWSEELNGVRWGDRSVVVTWPPVGGAVEVLAQADVVTWEFEYPPGELPAVCRDAETATGAGPINEYARSLGDRNGGLFVANNGTLVLQVVDDPAPHRAALAELGGACVVEVSRSAAEQRRIKDAIVPLLAEIPELTGIYGAGSGPGGRVVVQVPVADRTTARAIAELVDDPSAIRIVGIGILLP